MATKKSMLKEAVFTPATLLDVDENKYNSKTGEYSFEEISEEKIVTAIYRRNDDNTFWKITYIEDCHENNYKEADVGMRGTKAVIQQVWPQQQRVVREETVYVSTNPNDNVNEKKST